MCDVIHAVTAKLSTIYSIKVLSYPIICICVYMYLSKSIKTVYFWEMLNQANHPSDQPDSAVAAVLIYSSSSSCPWLLSPLPRPEGLSRPLLRS